MNRKRAITLIELLVAISIIAIFAGLLGGINWRGGGYMEERTATIEPIRLYTVPTKSGTSYRCYAKVLRTDAGDENLDAETTFEITDSYIKGQHRSADLYGKLREGEEFEITYYGVRDGYLSQFPKIIAVGFPKAASGLDDLYDK